MKWFLLAVIFSLLVAVAAGGRAETREKYRTRYWFDQFMRADSARVQCESVQGIIFPWDTAETEI